MTESSSPSVVEWERVSFAYGSVPAVEDVSLCIHYGELAAILGPNGGGKSTLIKLALGLLQPDAGKVRLFGRDVADFDDWRRVGYMPQVVAGVWRDFPATVSEVVAHGAHSGVSPLGLFRRSERADVLEALAVAGMTAFRSRRLSELSVGQQQRVLLARALVRQPELLVLDEPAAGVDVSGEEQLYAVLRDINRERGIAVIIVSHDIGAMLREASTLACMDRRLVLHGHPHDLTLDELSTLYGVPVDVLVHDALHEFEGVLHQHR
ncbi:MAG: metal ABC transporter ATP-binding protein [Chloroflexota bacterium]|nr:metal ABC transporter ATP-binding protein [Chloroflexota bacterium]MDE2897369.1 metal ABC transporter ATP-binding protein [Chloroflexota bacterium]